jgi:hypothetical protein
MGRQLATSRRRSVLGTIVAAIVVLAVGASQGLAGASGNGTTVTVPVQYHGNHCGVDTGKPFIGKARVTLSQDGTLSVKIQLTGADPGDYELEIYKSFSGGGCDELDEIGEFKVGSSGEASRVFQKCCFSSGRYFLDPDNKTTSGKNDNDTLTFKL